MATRPTLCARLTPAGRGAIATVAVRGPEAKGVVGRVFRPLSYSTLDSRQTGEIVVGVFSSGAASGEELVVSVVAPDEVEIHCHGGLAATSSIVEALKREGCQVQSPAEWVTSVAADPFRASARLALCQATTARTAAYLLDQYHGILSETFDQIQRLKASGDEQAAERVIHELLRWADFGQHLTQPWRVVLAGEPNSGKSSLMNAIMGYQRSIVFDQPGTTRDVLLATTAIEGWPVELRDMAGLRVAGDAIESAGVERAWQEIAAADLVLFISDATAPWDAALYEQVLAASQRHLLVIHNKCDLPSASAEDRLGGHLVSAVRGDGIEALCRATIHALIPEVPSRGSPIPFTTDQVSALKTFLTLGRSETP